MLQRTQFVAQFLDGSAHTSDDPDAELSIFVHPALHVARLLPLAVHVTDLALSTALHAVHESCALHVDPPAAIPWQKYPDLHAGTVLPAAVHVIDLAFATASQGSQHSDAMHVELAQEPVGSEALMNIPAPVHNALGKADPPPL